MAWTAAIELMNKLARERALGTTGGGQAESAHFRKPRESFPKGFNQGDDVMKRVLEEDGSSSSRKNEMEIVRPRVGKGAKRQKRPGPPGADTPVHMLPWF